MNNKKIIDNLESLSLFTLMLQSDSFYNHTEHKMWVKFQKNLSSRLLINAGEGGGGSTIRKSVSGENLKILTGIGRHEVMK